MREVTQAQLDALDAVERETNDRIERTKFSKALFERNSDIASKAAEDAGYLLLYWQGLLAEIEVLRSGDYDESDLPAFSVLRSIEDDFESAQQFRDAFAYDVGAASGLITSISSDLLNSLGMSDED